MKLLSRGQRGVTLIEVIVSIGILATITTGIVALSSQQSDDTRAAVVALHLKTVGDAANEYIKDNYAAVIGSATATAPTLIRVSDLIAGGYLNAGYSVKNARQQDTCVLVLEPTANNLTGMVVTEGGDTIDDLTLGQIAATIGAAGGGIYSTATTTFRGAMGGWSTPVGSFANANNLNQKCDGSAGAITLAAGHNSMAMWFADGAGVSGTLYRDAVPSNPSLNTMNTPIIMASIQTTGAACVTTGAIARDAGGAVVSCQSGTWKPMGDGKCVYTTENLNILHNDGRCYNGAGNANSPAGAEWFFLEVYRHVNEANFYTVQRVMGMTSAAVGKVWHRNQQSGVAGAGWSAWVQQADDKVSIWSQPAEGGVVTITANDGNKMHIQTIAGGKLRLVNSPWNAELASFDQSGNLTLNQDGATNKGYINAGWAVETWGCSANGSLAKSAYNVNDGWAWNGKPLHCEAGVWSSSVTANTILAAGTITPGWGVETWGCSPTGAIARASYTVADGWAWNGKTLTCQSGIWKDQAGGSGLNSYAWYADAGQGGPFTNYYGKAIYVSTYHVQSSGGRYRYLYVNGMLVSRQNGYTYVDSVSAAGWVPPGATWQINASAAGTTYIYR